MTLKDKLGYAKLMYIIRHVQKPTTRRMRKARKPERQNRRKGRLLNARH